MIKNGLSGCAALGIAALVSACTITAMRADNERRADQVSAKESQVQQEEQTQLELQSERQRLVDDLQTRELTLNEMNDRLTKLQRLNDASRAATREQRRQRDLRKKKLSEAAKEIKALDQDSGLSEDAKRKRLETLRRELRKTMELLVIA